MDKGKGKELALPSGAGHNANKELAIKAYLEAYPNLDRHLVELAWEYDQKMKQEHGEGYDPTTVLQTTPLEKAELEFYDGPQRDEEEIMRDEVIKPLALENDQSVVRPMTDEDIKDLEELCTIEEEVDKLNEIVDGITLNRDYM